MPFQQIIKSEGISFYYRIKKRKSTAKIMIFLDKCKNFYKSMS
jgi:hypothetical protein